MKKQSVVAYILRLSLTLLVITGVMAVLLAGVNAITEPKIAAANAERTRKAISQVLPDGATAKEMESFTDSTGLVQTVYATETGYAVLVTPSGFDGEITMMVGVDMEGKVMGVSIISQTDTPGLGAVCAATTAKGEAFRNQFIGQSGTLAVTKDGGTIEALTSATITSRGVTEGVNAALLCVENLRKG